MAVVLPAPVGPMFAPLLAEVEPVDYNTLPAVLDPASFRNWPASYKQSYVALHGTGVPQSVLIGVLGAGSLIASSDGVAASIVNEPGEAGQLPASLSPFTFVAWPESYQKAYVAAHQAGVPPSVMIGTLGLRSIIASLVGGVLSKTPEPANATALPAKLSPSVFAAWPEVYRLAYVAHHDTSGTGKLLIGTLGSGSSLATSAAGAVTMEPEPGTAGTAPAALSRATFESWSVDFRAVYVTTHQTGTPPGVIIGPLGGGSAFAALSGGLAVLTAEPADIGNAPAALARAAFEAWPVPFQVAYVEARKTGTPPAVIIGTLGAGSVELRRAGNGVAITAEPAAITTAPTALPLATFFSWPKSYQTAYVAGHQSGVPLGVQIGTPAGGTVFASAIAGDLALQPEPFGFNSAPKDVSPSAFADWPPIFKAAYFEANKSGSPPTLLLGTIGAGSVLYNAALVATSEPAGAALSPNLVSPATFAAWALPFRMAYVEARGIGTPKALLLGEIGSGSQVQRINGATLTSINEPAGAAALPAASSAATVATWDVVFQRAYVAKHGVGSPKYIMLGNTEQNAVTLAADGLTLSLSAKPSTYVFDTLTGKATPTATPESYLSWPNPYQQQYFADHGTGTPKKLTITSATGTTFTVTAAPSGAIVIDALNFWETQFANPTFDPVIQETPGDAKDIPYYELAGSAAGIPSTQVREDARDLFDIYDGDLNKLSLAIGVAIPDGFTTAPPTGETAAREFLEKFAGWHSAFQLEYIKVHGVTQSGTKVLNVPPHTGTAAPYPLLTAVVSIENPEKFFIVQNLQKGDIARMSLGDQNAVAATASFRYEISGKLGYQPTSSLTKFTLANGTDVTSVGGIAVQNWTSADWRTQLTDFVDDTIAGMQTKPLTNRTTDAAGNAISAMPDEFVSLFTDQLNNLVGQLVGMGIFSQDDIKKRVGEIKDRFDRAFAFYDVTPPTTATVYYINKEISFWDGFPFSAPPASWQPPYGWTPPSHWPDTSGWPTDIFSQLTLSNEWTSSAGNNRVGVPLYNDVISRDDNKTINRGFEVFITQERKIRDLENARLSMAQSGELLNKSMDAPSLIYYFQYHYNLQVEAVIVIETEEVNQMNELLKVYAAMQTIVSDTLKTFDGDAEQKKGVQGRSHDDLPDISEADRKIISMFEDNEGPAGQRHPLELLRNIQRPKHNIINSRADGSAEDGDVVQQLKTSWDTFASQLSETVTLLNQESQIKMNDINSMDKQKNRHYELANGALSKMFDMISSIARVG